MDARLKIAVPATISPTCPVQLATVSALFAPVVAKIRNVLIIKNDRVIFDHGKFCHTLAFDKAVAVLG